MMQKTSDTAKYPHETPWFLAVVMIICVVAIVICSAILCRRPDGFLGLILDSIVVISSTSFIVIGLLIGKKMKPVDLE